MKRRMAPPLKTLISDDMISFYTARLGASAGIMNGKGAASGGPLSYGLDRRSEVYYSAAGRAAGSAAAAAAAAFAASFSRSARMS
jgi:hypothetical protein